MSVPEPEQSPRPLPPPPVALLSQLRDGRFSRGLQCPRCLSRKVQRWGSFRGRQRYRCGDCRRTFSDLTGTPAAFSKKLHLWAEYRRCMEQGLSVRRAAAQVGLHPSTAFRWRHALLDGLRARDNEWLAGWIELDTLWLAYSEKGQRRRRMTRPRRRGRPPTLPLRHAAVAVLFACDRLASVVTAVAAVRMHVLVRRLMTYEIEDALKERIAGQPIVSAAAGRYSPAATYTRRLSGTFLSVPRGRSMARFGLAGAARRSVHANGDAPGEVHAPPEPLERDGTARPASLAHTRTVCAYAIRLSEWMERFRGVATRYLRNYLVWHRAIDHPWRHSARAVALRWPIPAHTT